MLCKVLELSGKPLDYAVAVCEGAADFLSDGITCYFKLNGESRVLSTGWGVMSYTPSVSWINAGPIIDREKISILPPIVRRVTSEKKAFPVTQWRSILCHDENDNAIHASGDTPLLAAMRCFVASKHGETIEIPDELINV